MLTALTSPNPCTTNCPNRRQPCGSERLDSADLMAWADQHCHLPNKADDVEALVVEAREAGVRMLVNVGVTVEDSCQAIATAAAHDGVWATAGVHPHSASDGIAGVEDLLDRPEVVAVGEVGLDYHYDHSPRAAQRDVFAAQIELANRHELALVVHTRSAWDDTFSVFDREGMPQRTVMHCFTGGTDEVSECLDRGALISFSGIVTFPKAPEVRAAVRVCPLDRLMVETDSPYLAPVPHRGRPNRPALVPLVGAAVAGAKDIGIDEVERATWATTLEFYQVGDFYRIEEADAAADGNSVAAGAGAGAGSV